jgi:hypothetical protein
MGFVYNKVNSTILYPVNKTIDAITGITSGLVCLGKSIFGSDISLGSILGGIGAVAAGLAAAILNSVTKVILKRVNQIVKSVLSPINQITNIINDITRSLIGIQKIIAKATDLDNYLGNRQNCAINGANIFNCLAQSAINKISNKVAMNVDKHIGKIANDITKESMGVNGAIAEHVKRSTGFLDKAKLQQRLMS